MGEWVLRKVLFVYVWVVGNCLLNPMLIDDSCKGFSMTNQLKQSEKGDVKILKKLRLITPEITRDKGGIQNWMYFVEKLLQYKKYSIEHFAYKEDRKIDLLKMYSGDVFILATWKMAVFILPVLFFTNKKTFIFVHGNEILKLNSMMTFFLKLIANKSDVYFIANSKSIANMLTNIIERDIDFIQHPFMEIVCRKNRVVDSDNIFFTLTRLVKRKNIDNVIYAFKKLKDEGVNFVYRIAGTGPEINNLQELVSELSLDSEITFLGKVSDEDKNKYYATSNYFLLPSLFDEENASIEGYGIVFIEANAYGIPVLSGNTGGMLEAVIDGVTGLHCDGSVNDIYTKIKLLLKMDFDRKYILDHAKDHDYLSQDGFVHFMDKKINE